MRYALAVLAAAIVLASLAGCDAVPAPTPSAPEQSRLLGQVNYDDAFAAAQAVFGRHFEIASADPLGGVIASEPKPIQAGGERLLGNSPARQIATMTLVRQRQQVVVRLAVVEQRQGREVREAMSPPGDPYSSVPNETPAADTAATTAEQNSTWRAYRRDRALEARMLQELSDALHPQATSTAPAAGEND